MVKKKKNYKKTIKNPTNNKKQKIITNVAHCTHVCYLILFFFVCYPIKTNDKSVYITYT